MSARAPTGLLSHHKQPQHQQTQYGAKKQHCTIDRKESSVSSKQSSLPGIVGHNNNASTHNGNGNGNGNKNSVPLSQREQPSTTMSSETSILNVAEMILHGVADHEILDIWLRSIACQEFAKNFVEAGYDMPTISRITPQDLTAIGITDPAKRLKILSEIKKLNLQDGIPNFKPANLSHWLSLLRLDNNYYKSLCDQQINTIEKTCQLTWEDLEDLGITKLGHQKRLLLAIERMKVLNSEESKSIKTLSEPIYDTSPSQILLVASAENHSMNGPIINKQSSTSELSSTGSGSMHSLYSANSIHYQPTYAALPITHQQHEQHQQHQKFDILQQQLQTQPIYSQTPSHIMQPPPPPVLQPPPPPVLQPPLHQTPQHQTLKIIPPNQQQAHNQQNSHYQAIQSITNPSQYMNSIYSNGNLSSRNTMAPITNRQSLGQLPFSALANLPKQQQHLLQQCSIYATLSRQPQRVKQPPPPVPVRTNSLKTNSLVDEETIEQGRRMATNNSSTNSQTSTLYRFGTRVPTRNQPNQQTQLSKNKSFSGNAYMDAARARFLDRPNQQQPQVTNSPQLTQAPMNDHNSIESNRNITHNTIYGVVPNLIRPDVDVAAGHSKPEGDNLSIFSRQSIPSAISSNQASLSNPRSIDVPINTNCHIDKKILTQSMTRNHILEPSANSRYPRSDDCEVYSDTNSTKSLILQPTNVNTSPISSNRQTSLSQESGSSQTLYNSASSGSSDQNMNACHFLRSADLASRHSTTSDSTLNDVNLILDQQAAQHMVSHFDSPIHSQVRAPVKGVYECNATTGKDDDFPPPPSPLSLTDVDDREPNSLNPDNNFANISQGLMTFRVGT